VAVSEAIQVLRASSPDADIEAFLGEVSQAVHASKETSVHDVHVSALDTAFKRHPKARQTYLYLLGFFDGACEVQSDVVRNGADLVACTARYARRWAETDHGFHRFLVILADEFEDFHAQVLNEAPDFPLEGAKEFVIGTIDNLAPEVSKHHLRLKAEGKPPAPMVLAVDARLRAFLNGYVTMLSVGDPIIGYEEGYKVLIRTMVVGNRLASDGIRGRAFRQVAGIMTAATARNEAPIDILDHLEKTAFGRNRFDIDAPLVASTAAGQRAAAYLDGFRQGLAKTVATPTFEAYLKRIQADWPFGPADFSYQGPQGHYGITEYLEALRARLGSHGEPATATRARINGWLDAHVLGCLHH
jgi:hypothetical protein